VLPFFGPSTLRDTAGMPVDLYGDLWTYKRPTRWRNVGAVVRIVDRRAQLLDASTLLEDAALDKYDFVRDAYLQRRQSQINGGSSGREQKEEAIKP
jgi:phospholipid-binding lipoprotein MlaA